ncbi:MAG: hypothetical protein HY787_03865 [Deltaproteobacteria bacterium]|jgi:hypothetical protein|nr:hypothetical protein [Deltaproteobacteria bacterium]
MKLTSAGLGKTELDAVIVGMKKVDDVILLAVDVTKPTKWHTRMGLQEKDLRILAWQILKPGNFWFIIRSLLSKQK